MKFFSFISYFPLFFVILILYHVMTFFGVDFTNIKAISDFTLPSGQTWGLTSSDLFILLSVFTLYIEIIKSTRTGAATIFEHVLSMGVFLLCLMDFLFVKSAGTSAFLIMTLMSLLDVIAGFTITVAAARRDFAMGG